MSTSSQQKNQVRAAAAALVAALERHLAVVEVRSGESDPAVQRAFTELSEAFVTYDDLLCDIYDEVTPFEVADEVDDDDEDDDDVIEVVGALDDEDDEDDEDDDYDAEQIADDDTVVLPR